MLAAAARLPVLGAIALGAMVGLLAADPVVRVPPSRPLPLATTQFNGVTYVSVADVASRLGLKGAWIEPAREFSLVDRGDRVELTAESRHSTVNGLRIFFGDPVVLRGGQLYLSKIDFELRLVPLLRPGLGAAVPPRLKVIALDPGHGLPDDGMQNEKLGLKERVLTLDVALRLQKLLEVAGYKVVLTRTGDNALSPEKKLDFPLRDEIANRAKADLFVSIHFNSLYPDTKTSGTEIYTFPPKTQHAADWWSEMRKDDPDVEMSDEPVNRHDFWSVVLAEALHRSVLASLKTTDRGAKLKHLAVLRNLNCPGVLVESVFLSNESEARRAATPEYRQQIAEAIGSGIVVYAETLDRLQPPEIKSPATLVPPPPSSPANNSK